MDHNNKHLLPGFQFPATAAFAGLQNGNALVQLSQLSSQLSSLSNPILPTPELNLSAWAAATQNQQWLDQAKLSAAMFPGLYLKGGLDYSQQVDITAQQVAAQAAQVQQVHQVQHVQQPTSIFPAAVIAAKIGKISSGLQHEYAQEFNKNQSPVQQPLSSGPSSHPSTSTPHDIDVGGLSQPSSHHQIVNHSPQKVLQGYEAIDENRPSTSTAVPSLPLSHDIFAPSISTSLANIAQTWDVPGDIMANLFNNSTKPDTNVDDSKEREEDDNINLFWMDGMDDDAIIDDEQSKHGKDKDLFAIDVRSADGLSPIQFTPPDSPVGAGSGAAEAAMAFTQAERPGPSNMNGHVRPEMMESERPTPVATPMLILPDTRRPDASSTPASLPRRLATPRPPKPIADPIYRKTEFVSKPVQKLNKVPVYKQKQKNVTASLVVDDFSLKDDAYSFEDDEDHGVCKLDPREKLDAEVKEKLSKIASQPAGSTKNIYVPGVGFAVPQDPVPQQDLWRHVVPKKRPIAENRPIIPAANLLPSSVHAEASEAAARLAEPEILSLAESIRRRKKDRFIGNFVKFENTVSTECVKEERKKEPENTLGHSDENRPPLPKLIIKLPKKVYDSYEHKKKKKKKRKRRRQEEDSDWEDYNYRKRSRGRSERRDSGYEIRVVEPTVSFKQEEEKPEPMIPKKRRLLQWQEGQEVRANGQHSSNSSHSKAEFNTEAIKLRLSKFGPAEGHLPKGTFVVCKADLFREDCALWKVDNQNMLQKYPPKVDPLTNLYSGWCEQIASGYYRVSIKHIKQTRSEAVVQPEIALSDLFPAMTSECADTNGFFKLDGWLKKGRNNCFSKEQLPDSNEHMNMLRDPLRLSLYTYTQNMLDHALTLDRLQVMKDKNDWSFLQAVSDIERANEDSIVRINQQVQMRDEFTKLLQQYVQLHVIDHDAKEIHCQACSVEKRSVEKIVQLLCLDNYDRQSLMSQPFPVVEGEDPPLPACEMFVCSVCAIAARQFHNCYHMSYHLLKKCEDRLELIGTQHPELSPERIVDVAKKTRGWQNNMFSDYVDMWKKIQNNSNNMAQSHSTTMSYYTNTSSYTAPSY